MLETLSNTTIFDPSNHTLVHITGSIVTTQMYNGDLALKKSSFYKYFKNESETDMSALLQLSPLVINALVSVYDVRLPEASNHHNLSTTNVTLEFNAVCSIRVVQTFDLEDISSSINSSITDAETSHYKFYDENSLSSIIFIYEKPTIIKIESQSKKELTEKIGLFNLLN